MSATPPSTPRCAHCRTDLPAFTYNTEAWTACPSCWVRMRAWAFPALLRPPASPTVPERIVDSAESGCFNHPEQRAETVCESCGRFLCRLCDIELAGKHLCSSCIETGRRKGKIRNLQNERTRHDLVAVTLAALPMLLVFPSLVTAPIALVYSVWGWRRPHSLVHRSNAGFVIAILLSILQICGWAFFFLFVKRVGRS